MFPTKSRSRRHAKKAQVAATKAHAAAVKAQAAALKEKVGPAAHHARDNALVATGAAREWAAPRYKKARDKGLEKAAPRVEHAAESLSPKVDAARDRIVEDVLPRIVEAVTAAAAVAAAKTEEAREASQHGLASVSDHAKSTRKSVKPRRRKRKAFLVLTVVGAAAGAGYTAWKRSQPADDPWVTATGSSSSGTSASRLSGGTSSGGLGAGTLATESTDVDTPAPDGLASGEQQRAGGGEVNTDKTGADASTPSSSSGESTVGAMGAPSAGSDSEGGAGSSQSDDVTSGSRSAPGAPTPSPSDAAKASEVRDDKGSKG